jgi:ZIP family zinc transporter
MSAIFYTLIPLVAVLVGAILSTARRPGAGFVSAMQHLAAGVVFAAAATEILPQIKHDASPAATLLGGIVGVAVMLLLKQLEGRAKGPVAMLGAVGIDILVDGLVLGLAFVAGRRRASF